jgi:hypothetical protein
MKYGRLSPLYTAEQGPEKQNFLLVFYQTPNHKQRGKGGSTADGAVTAETEEGEQEV